MYLHSLRIRPVFRALHQHARGAVLDIGGRDFFQYVVQDPLIQFDSWICLELERSATDNTDTRYKLVIGDGENPPFETDTFDTVINLQVLEHTLHPEVMVREIARVLKKGGKAVFLIPQTSALHEIPTHYYNFTKYWVQEIFPAAGLEIIELTPLGGRWSTHASHMFHFFLEAFRIGDYSSKKEYPRSILFFLLFPLMAMYALLGVAFGLLFSFADLTEDPNNLLVIARKK